MRNAAYCIQRVRSKSLRLRKHALVRILEDTHGTSKDNFVEWNRFKKGDVGVYHRSTGSGTGKKYWILADDGKLWNVWRGSFEVIGYKGEDNVDQKD